ncbi:efflux transporter outer membrane subunit (plasmid) [Comamonadaceae bacterium OTU4NAUVB1]|nr:efflux transporter outer membrane subunit [Comamonadaceae bacterium OTU4NAUVB1]
MSGHHARGRSPAALPACLAALLLVSACAAPPAPAVPDAATVAPPPAWRTPADVAGPPIDPRWWRAFGDDTLARLVDQALARNTDIATAVARLAEARAQAALARAQLAPSLDLGASASRTRSLSAVTGQPVTSTSAQPQLQLAYEVDLFGRLADLSEASRAAFLASATARDATALSVAAATAGGYLTLRGLDARLEVARETLAARTEALRLARSRAEAGYTSQLELRQAQVEQESAVQLVPQLRLAIARQENALALLLGEAPGDVPRGAPLLAMRLPPVPAGLPADVLRRRPDIAQAEYALAATDATLSATRKQFLPAVRLTGSTGVLLLNSLSDPTTLWTLGGSVLAPLFSGGRLRAQAEVAVARRDQAAFAYRRTTLTAFREVEDALAGVARLAEQGASLERQRALLSDTLRLATSRYRAGYATYLEQLDAQRGLLGAELSLLQARADLLNAAVSLYQAMGGGWDAGGG